MTLMSLILFFMFILLWKWAKSLQVIVSLEILTMLLISGVCSSSLFSSLFVMFLLFFVGEALILLSSLLSVLRTTGLTHSVISLG